MAFVFFDLTTSWLKKKRKVLCCWFRSLWIQKWNPKNTQIEWKKFEWNSGMNLYRHIYLINMFFEETGSRKTRITFTQILMKIWKSYHEDQVGAQPPSYFSFARHLIRKCGGHPQLICLSLSPETQVHLKLPQVSWLSCRRWATQPAGSVPSGKRSQVAGWKIPHFQ